MEEKAEKKNKKWTIRITLQDTDDDAPVWDARELSAIVLRMIENTEELADRNCTRLEVENDDY